MMRRLLDAVVKPMMSYDCNLQPGLKGMVGLQITFFRQLLKLRRAPWQQTWWFQVLSFMHRLDSMAEGSLHPHFFE